MDGPARYRAQLARILSDEPPRMADVVALVATACPELFGARRPSAFAGCFGAPAGAGLGPSVRWPDGSTSYAAGPHLSSKES